MCAIGTTDAENEVFEMEASAKEVKQTLESLEKELSFYKSQANVEAKLLKTKQLEHTSVKSICKSGKSSFYLYS